MGSRWIAAGMAAIAVAAGAAGCGGSSSDDDKTTASTTATTPTTSSESTGTQTATAFTAKADAICRDATARMSTNAYPTRPSGFPAWGKRIEAVQDERIQRLGELTAPEAQREAFEQLKRHLQLSRDLTRPLVTKMAQGGRIDDLGAAGRANIREFRAIDRYATALGIPACRS